MATLYISNISPGEVEPCASCKHYTACKTRKLACQAFWNFVHSGKSGEGRHKSRYWYKMLFPNEKLSDANLRALIAVSKEDQTYEDLKARYGWRVLKLEQRSAA